MCRVAFLALSFYLFLLRAASGQGNFVVIVNVRLHIHNSYAGESILCGDGELRLVGGRHSSEGRLEWCSEGVWGTVCNNGWGDTAAGIACAELEQDSSGNFTGMIASESLDS